MIRRAFSSSAVLAGRTIKYQQPVAQRKQDKACVDFCLKFVIMEVQNFWNGKKLNLTR